MNFLKNGFRKPSQNLNPGTELESRSAAYKHHQRDPSNVEMFMMQDEVDEKVRKAADEYELEFDTRKEGFPIEK